MSNQLTPTTKVVTGKVRFSYLHAFEPKAIEEGSEPKYSVCLLISKSDTYTLKKVNEAIDNAFNAGKAKFGGKLPTKWKHPLRDGDEERPDDEAYENCYFINANSKTKPGLVNKSMNAIIDPDELYSGCYGRASVNFYAFNTAGNKGVACGLNNLQKLADGERLSGGSTAEEDFGDLPFEDEGDDLL